MATTAVPPPPPPVAGLVQNGGAAGGAPKEGMSPAQVNSFRISTVIDRLYLHVRSHVINDGNEFSNLCYSLSRGIDFGVANHEVPSRAQELPSLLKQVCRWKKDDDKLQAAVMVLMISVKYACQSGWFSDKDTKELNDLIGEIASQFYLLPDFNIEQSCSRSVISTIMSRFYPRLKMGQMLVTLEAKTGYDAYVSDFLIPKTIKSVPGDKIRLFVVQTDSIETASCLISPPKANFLLNGRAVENRNTIFMDTGPQIPTVVRHLLKYGSNLLQAIGDFSGNYIIAVAIMREVPNPGAEELQDYEEHAPAILESDPEVVEGASRISLNCPISFTRIKTPVKGYSCKHIQCFDFENYVDINSRRPSWRCPHCNQPVCFTDIRIDQKMFKILKEVGPKVTDIVVSEDGSWSVAMEIDDATQKPEDMTTITGEHETPQPENVSTPNRPMDILDLTETDDLMDVVIHVDEDRKLNASSSQSQSVAKNVVVNPPAANTNDICQTNRVEDEFWSGVFLSTFGAGSPIAQPTAQTAVASATLGYPMSPFLPDPMNSAPRGEVEPCYGGAGITASSPQNELSSPNALQLQQYQFGNPAVTNEYGRFPSLPRYVTRTPVAVQALPAAQTPTSVLQQRSRSRTNAFIHGGLSTASQSPPVSSTVTNSNIRSNTHQVPHMSPPLHQYPVLQPQQSVGLQAPNQVPRAYRIYNEFQTLSQPVVNMRMPQAMSQPPSSAQSASFLRPQSNVGVSHDRANHATNVVSSQQAQLVAAANRAVQMSFDPSRTVPPYSVNSNDRRIPSPADQRVNTGVSLQPPMRTDSYDPADQSWRPAGRMRGALTGRAYSEAMNQYIIQPNQQAQAQAARPIPNVMPLPPNISVPPQPLMNHGVSPGSIAPNYTLAGPGQGPANRPGMF